MENSFCMPITQEYETRGCRVTINAASNSDCVDIAVVNLKSGYGGTFRHVLFPYKNDKGYSDTDMHSIKSGLNSLLDQYGDSEWEKIHFTNQILM